MAPPHVRRRLRTPLPRRPNQTPHHRSPPPLTRLRRHLPPRSRPPRHWLPPLLPPLPRRILRLAMGLPRNGHPPHPHHPRRPPPLPPFHAPLSPPRSKPRPPSPKPFVTSSPPNSRSSRDSPLSKKTGGSNPSAHERQVTYEPTTHHRLPSAPAGSHSGFSPPTQNPPVS